MIENVFSYLNDVNSSYLATFMFDVLLSLELILYWEMNHFSITLISSWLKHKSGQALNLRNVFETLVFTEMKEV